MRSARSFSALQRAEIAEIIRRSVPNRQHQRFSALQRAEIAEIETRARARNRYRRVSVLFNEPKLLKFYATDCERRFVKFQCSSTSRNC